MYQSTMPIPNYFWSYIRTDSVNFEFESNEENCYSSVVIISINNPYLRV